MNRQLLRRPESPGTAGPTRPARPGAPAAAGRPAAPPDPERARVLRRPVVLVLVAVSTVVVGGLAWSLMSSPAPADTGSAPSAFVRTTTSATSPATSARASSATSDPLRQGRDPFAGASVAPTTAPGTPPHVSAAPSPAQDLGTGAPSPVVSGATGPTTQPVPSTSASTPDPSVVTVTVTAPGAPTYVGLYAWNGNRASFRVNARTYSVRVGTRFGPRLTFTAVVVGDPPCARISHPKGSFTLCPGQVTTLP